MKSSNRKSGWIDAGSLRDAMAKLRRKLKPTRRRSHRPLDFLKVLSEELEALTKDGPTTDTVVRRKRTAIESAHRRQAVGLAFSGGGIRSATFNLGVLQALAYFGLLRSIDYLSTVSGGGYIGAWLTAWIHREGIEEVEEKLTREVPLHEKGKTPRFPRRSPITFLRQFSNYLTPTTGAFSVDTWTAVATYGRNLFLNLTILVLAISAALLVPWAILGWAVWANQHGWVAWAPGLSAFCLLVAISVTAWNFDRRTAKLIGWFRTTRAVILFAMTPLFASGFFLALWLPVGRQVSAPIWVSDLLPAVAESPRLLWAVGAGASYALFWLSYPLISGALRISLSGRLRGRRLRPWWLVPTAALAGLLGGLVLYELTAAFHSEDLAQWVTLVTWGPPTVVMTFVLTAVLHIGFLGREFIEEHREWWSRLGAWLVMLSITWPAFFGLVFYGPPVLEWLNLQAAGKLGLSTFWAAATGIGVWAARGGEAGKGTAGRLLQKVALVTPYIFVIGLVLILAMGAHVLYPRTVQALEGIGHHGEVGALHFQHAEAGESFADLSRIDREIAARAVAHFPFGPSLAVLVVFLAALALSSRVDINEFSMHLFYRNRLIRAYLGASRNWEREPVEFTGFDPEDDLRLDELAERGYEGPLPIFNTTLNLASGKELAWQERKANSFIFTPLHYGFDPGRHREGGSARALRRGYRPIRHAGGEEGITLGTAMAISGAALSPNMGYQSSPALSFLMTFFNTRLGWWLGNPRRSDSWRLAGPRVGVSTLIAELLGNTHDNAKYVNLSDGGFFDNLGIYELVKRRCRFILACDVEADPNYEFAALGTAIRRIRSDLGIDVEIDLEPIRKQENGFSLWHCAVGSIRYNLVDQDAPKGTLVYLKASLTGDEPEDLLNYAKSNPGFPNESTADQWFGEAQFESYRMLGFHSACDLLGAATEPRPRRKKEGRETTDLGLGSAAGLLESAGVNIESIFVGLRQAWYPPSPAVAAAFTRHAEQLEEIFERLRTDPQLSFLDRQLYPEVREWKRHRPVVRPFRPRRIEERPAWEMAEENLRAGFYFCNSMIQLMEVVYLDLDLENDWRHPDNRGWMNLFLHWTWSPMFRMTWSICASTYGARFQNFCSRRLGLGLGQVWAERLRPEGRSAAEYLDVVESRLRAGEIVSNEARVLRGLIRPEVETRRGSRAEEAGQRLTSLPSLIDDVVILKLFVLKSSAALLLGRKNRFATRDRPAEADELYHFTFGVAALSGGSGGTKVVFLRVRDHLRKLGLGRTAIERLIVDHGVADAELVDNELLRRFYRRINRQRFEDLFKSVQNEIWRSRMGLDQG